MALPLFEIEALEVRAVEGPDILHGVDLTIGAGEIHAVMGPNGSGKSTLATTLMGSPEYEVTAGHLRMRGDDITDWDADVRAKAGMFLAFQYPQEISGVCPTRGRRISHRHLCGDTGMDGTTRHGPLIHGSVPQ